MAKTGGYKIINLEDKPLANGTEATISGIYEAIEGNHRRAILLSGIVIDGVEKADAWPVITISGTNYKLAIYGRIITITNKDKVSIDAQK